MGRSVRRTVDHNVHTIGTIQSVLDNLVKLSPIALIGFLFGLFSVWWINPTTNGGTILVVAICVAISITLGMVLRYVSNRIAQKRESTESSANKNKRNLWLPGDD